MRNLGILSVATAGLIGWSTVGSAADLTILHINDHHSHLSPDGRLDLQLGGERTRVEGGGFPRVVTKFKELSEGRDDVLTLHAGDAITGDLYYTLFKGQADADLMNVICFDAFAVGNHEFDDGDAGLKRFIDFLWADEACQTPVLGANVQPEVGVSPLTPNAPDDYLKPYVIQDVGGASVGIIGIDIANKTMNSSSPDPTTAFLDEAETAQRFIDELETQGVDRIVLLTHYQYRNDLALAESLRGVDVIIGGDSHTLLGDFEGVGLNAAGPYPTLVTGAEGGTVCVAQAWQYAQIVGELTISFDDKGQVTDCSGTPHLPLGDTFRRKNADGDRVELEGDARAAVLAAVDAHPSLSVTEPDQAAQAVLAQYEEQVAAKKADVIGEAATTLCLERIPGQGKSSLCDVLDTAAKGSDIATIVAQAFREMSRTGDIAIQNAGGVRTDLAAGDISIGDAYTLMPFANTLVELTMTGAEIKAVLEDALDYALQPEGSTGAYPYAAGLRWEIDATAPMGERFSAMEFKGMSDEAWQPLDLERSYKVITNSYIAGGRDGYVTFKGISDDGRALDTYLDYAQSFVEYVKQRGRIERLPYEEYSTQLFLR